jgi:hypothetical protein
VDEQSPATVTTLDGNMSRNADALTAYAVRVQRSSPVRLSQPSSYAVSGSRSAL